MSPLPLDPAANLAVLLRCASVTPAEAGVLSELERLLRPLGFAVERPVFSDRDTPDVENLLATAGSEGRHLAFAGHTDVVPPGDESDWCHPPFSAAVENGEMFGRGAVDMKGAIACFVAALARLRQGGRMPQGRVSLLITGDEEGPAVNGTEKLLRLAIERGHRFDACLVGEPTNPERLGDAVKIGRRGSLTGRLTLVGRQGHVAYPHLADNPIRGLAGVLDAVLAPPLDAGSPDFPPSNLEITTIDTGNPSTNVVPARVSLSFNIRFNDGWTPETLKREIRRRIEEGLSEACHRPDRPAPLGYELAWRDRPSDVFLTVDEALVGSIASAVETVTGRRPALSTSGGTSDARFIRSHCPVVEFGLVGSTMHMANERVALADLETLTAVYETFITRWFAANA